MRAVKVVTLSPPEIIDLGPLPYQGLHTQLGLVEHFFRFPIGTDRYLSFWCNDEFTYNGLPPNRHVIIDGWFECYIAGPIIITVSTECGGTVEMLPREIEQAVRIASSWKMLDPKQPLPTILHTEHDEPESEVRRGNSDNVTRSYRGCA